MKEQLDEDDLIRLAMIGSFLTTYAGVRTGAAVLDQLYNAAESGPEGLLKWLGAGRKGGIL